MDDAFSFVKIQHSQKLKLLGSGSNYVYQANTIDTKHSPSYVRSIPPSFSVEERTGEGNKIEKFSLILL